MQIVSRIMRKFKGKIISLKKKKKIAVTNVKNKFLKGVTQNHCLGFLVMYYQNQVEKHDLIT